MTSLNSTIRDLKLENDRLELELSNATSFSAVQRAELLAVKEKIKDVSEKCRKIKLYNITYNSRDSYNCRSGSETKSY